MEVLTGMPWAFDVLLPDNTKKGVDGIQGHTLQSYVSPSDRTIPFRALPVSLSAG